MLKLVILLLIGCSLCMPLNQITYSVGKMPPAVSSQNPSQDPNVKTWHHDCSNTTGFRYEEIPGHFYAGTDYNGIWVNAEGNLESDGQTLFVMNATEPTSVYSQFFYGPTAVYDLPDTFPVSGLRNLSVQIELSNSNPEYAGVAAIALLDETLAPVLIAICNDRSSSAEGLLGWRYYPRNFTWLESRYFNKELEDYSIFNYESSLISVNTTWSASYTPNQGVWGYIPAFGLLDMLNGTIVTESDAEPARAIRYLGLMLGGYYMGSYQPVPPFRIHDIYLEYEVGGEIDTSPPLLTPQLDREYVVGQTGNAITWNCSDDHPYRYLLFRKYDDLLLEGGLWNGSPISISIDGLELDNYGFLLLLQDKAGFIVADYVKVEVIEDPLISSFVSFISSHPEILVIASVAVVGAFLYLREMRKAARYRKERISLYKKQWSSAQISL